MDVVLGVAVTGPVARLALLGSGAQGADVIDQSVVNLDDHPIEKLTETVVGTNRLLADEHHRLVATRLCWPDAPQADQLRRALEGSGVQNVAVLSESQAVGALMRAAGRAGGVLVVDDHTATLSMVDPAAGDGDAPPTVLAQKPLAGGLSSDATAALDTMMARIGDHPGAPGDLYVVGASSNVGAVADQLRDASTMRVEVPEDPTFALARGAALAAAPVAALVGPPQPRSPDATAMAPAAMDATAMAPAVGDATALAPAAAPAAEEPQLAYSMADEGEPLGMDDYGPEYDDLDEAEGQPARLSRRSLLIGNAVIVFAVVGLASLAAAVAIAVRPTAAQQPVVGHQNAAPGKFMPLLPTQQQAPVPPPPIDMPNAGFQGGTIPAPTGVGSVPQVSPPVVNGTPAAPVGPETPGTPGFVPNPNAPIPVPVIVPFPGWRPPYPYPNPYPPPYTPPTPTVSPPTTTVSPPTTTYSPPTTTVSPPTTTYSPPTTTYSPPTTTYSPPTTTYSPPTTTYSPPTTTHEAPTTTHQAPTSTYSPPPTTYSPPPTHSQTQQTIPPQTHTQQPVAPQQPHSGGGHHGFGF